VLPLDIAECLFQLMCPCGAVSESVLAVCVGCSHLIRQMLVTTQIAPVTLRTQSVWVRRITTVPSLNDLLLDSHIDTLEVILCLIEHATK
jgi:hypothetical protein